MTTARDIIRDAFYKITVLGTGQSLSNEDAVRGFNVLNQMLSMWSVDGNMIFHDTRETFTLTGAISYTIGPGATFDTVRPDDIVAAYTTDGNTDYHLTKYGVEQYARLDQKDTGGVPEIYYYDANFPIATLYLYPAPTSQTSITLFSRKPLTQFASLDADLIFPPEYETAMIYNLAVMISPEYEREPSRSVVKTARSAYRAVEKQNLRKDQNVSRIDVPKTEHQANLYNIFRGY